MNTYRKNINSVCCNMHCILQHTDEYTLYVARIKQNTIVKTFLYLSLVLPTKIFTTIINNMGELNEQYCALILPLLGRELVSSKFLLQQSDNRQCLA